MRLIRGLHNLRPDAQGCVLSIGNYDGVHRGHQALLARLKAHAQRLGLPATVMVFEPTPREYFTPQEAPRRVLTLRDKLAALEAFGVDQVVIARFDSLLAAYSPRAFVEDVIVKTCGAKAVVVGDDFRFGAKRAGDFGYLEQMGSVYGYTAERCGTLTVEGERCSSTALRAALAEPDLDKAQRLLGRRYSISGIVRHGLKLGRTLDMPTANLPLLRTPPLPYGVYVVRGTVAGTEISNWGGVASLGVRPSIGLTTCLLETHFFANPQSLYGKQLSVSFCKYLRPERRFDSLEALKAQMHQDAMDAKTWFANLNRSPAAGGVDASYFFRGA